ncbi:MAG: cardiolipin synthase [Prevotellaceae bacterium]|nr:cardiolipin synthase [Prevotellaceae bacterium]
MQMSLWVEITQWTIFIVYTVVTLGTMLVVLLENRQPAKTTAWLVVLALLPVAGLVFFFFFGQDLRRRRRLRTNHVFRETQSETEHKMQGTLQDFFARDNHAPLCRGSVSLLDSGQDYLEALLTDISQAKRYILIETFIYEDGIMGRTLRDALVRKAEAGLSVYLLYDDVGSYATKKAFFRSFGKVQTAAFLPVRFARLTRRANYRNHRKICVIDGHTAYAGGMNIADRYLSLGKNRPWRDLQLRTCGASAAELQKIFVRDWQYATRQYISLDKCTFSQEKKQNVCMQVVSGAPVARFPELEMGLTRLIFSACRNVYVQTPYFLPTEPVMKALQSAAMAGVDVRLILPEKPDSRLLRWGNATYLREVLEAGVRVYLMRAPAFLHAKAITVDDETASVGSANFDFRSFENNFETNVIVYDPQTAVAVREIMTHDLALCREISLTEWQSRPLGERLAASVTRIFSPLL